MRPVKRPVIILLTAALGWAVWYGWGEYQRIQSNTSRFVMMDWRGTYQTIEGWNREMNEKMTMKVEGSMVGLDGIRYGEDWGREFKVIKSVNYGNYIRITVEQEEEILILLW